MKHKMDSVFTEAAGSPIGPYSQAVVANGFIYTSGQIGLNSEGVLATGLEAQTLQVFANLEAILTAANSEPKNIVKSTIFLLNMEDFAQVNALYENFVKAPYPARSTIEVRQLPKGALIEIEVVATQN